MEHSKYFRTGISAADELVLSNLKERVEYLIRQGQPIPAEDFIAYTSSILSDSDIPDFLNEIADLEKTLEKNDKLTERLKDEITEKNQELQLLFQELVLDQYEGKNVPDEILERIAKLVPTQPTDSE